tara:strand:- start:3358 stop:4014 length:657 start_codon:yes stop_codon:yes gene_type:complete
MKRDEVKEYFRRAYKGVLLEQDEDPFGGDEEGGDEEADAGEDEEGGDDPFGGDEGGDEGGEEAEEDAGGDAGEEDEGPKAEEEDHVRMEKSLDDQLQAIFIDIESDAIKSAQVQEEGYSLKRLLLREQDEVTLDVDKFAAETARLIMNFDAFFDVEEMIMSKARSFLLDKYGEEVADEVEELLSGRHDIHRKEDQVEKKQEYEDQVPIAVGATGGAGA